MDDSEIIQECKKIVENNFQKIKKLVKQLEDVEDKTSPANLSADEIMYYNYLRNIQDKLLEIAHQIKYYQQPIKETGRLSKNKNGRYELPSGNYFTTGDPIEVKIYDDFEEKEKWIKSRVEHNEDYYVVGLENISMDNMLARVRKSYFNL